MRVLDAELEPLILSKAQQFKLPAEWVTRLAKVGHTGSKVTLLSALSHS